MTVMERRYLRVKFCNSEEELNAFLKKLPLEEYEISNGKENKKSQITKLHRITYLPKPNGKGNNDNMTVDTDFVMVVEYWDYDFELKEEKHE